MEITGGLELVCQCEDNKIHLFWWSLKVRLSFVTTSWHYPELAKLPGSGPQASCMVWKFGDGLPRATLRWDTSLQGLRELTKLLHSRLWFITGKGRVKITQGETRLGCLGRCMALRSDVWPCALSTALLGESPRPFTGVLLRGHDGWIVQWLLSASRPTDTLTIQRHILNHVAEFWGPVGWPALCWDHRGRPDLCGDHHRGWPAPTWNKHSPIKYAINYLPEPRPDVRPFGKVKLLTTQIFLYLSSYL